MTTFGDTIKMLNKRFKTCSTYALWVKLELYHDNDAGSKVEISTQDRKHNYIISIDNKKNGTGIANQITINLSFAPDFTVTGTDIDINLIDRALNSNAGGLCKYALQYGYSFTDDSLHSPVYKGFITNYQVSLDSGLLNYTLTAFSDAIGATEKTIEFTPKENVRCTEVAYEAISEYLSKLGYKAKYADGVEGTDAVVPEIGGMNCTIYEYLDSVLNSAEEATQAGDTSLDSSKKITYGWCVDETDGDDKSIVIYKRDPQKITQDEVLVFNWMEKGSNLVVQFSTQFIGSVLMAYSYSGEATLHMSIDSEGNSIVTSGMQSTGSGGDTASADASTDKRTWSDAINALSYQASLTMLGLPCEIPIGTIIKIVPLIYGVPHFSQGFYMITGMNDKISTGGFLTTIELQRMMYVDSDFDNVYNLSTDSVATYKKAETTIDSTVKTRNAAVEAGIRAVQGIMDAKDGGVGAVKPSASISKTTNMVR